MDLRSYSALMLAVFFATIGYGLSFPHLSLALNAQGHSSTLIGLNASMPAVGWIAASLLVPSLHRKLSVKCILWLFLALAVVGCAGFALTDTYVPWLACRLLFGGGLGMFFRTIEYALNADIGDERRGVCLGVYLVSFLLGIAIGSALYPVAVTADVNVYAGISLSLAVAGALISFLSLPKAVENAPASVLSQWRELSRYFSLVPVVTLIAVATYGLLESIPVYLISVYAVKSGMSESVAAYATTAHALAAMALAIPIGMASDRFGRQPVFVGCSLCCGGLALLMPTLVSLPSAFLLAVGLLGGTVLGLYTGGLAMLGDIFDSESLIYANAAFGLVYAVCSVVGPTLNGFAMTFWEPHGLMVFAAILLILLPAAWALERSRESVEGTT